MPAPSDTITARFSRDGEVIYEQDCDRRDSRARRAISERAEHEDLDLEWIEPT